MSFLKEVKPTRGELLILQKDQLYINKAVSLLDEKATVLSIRLKELTFRVNRLRKEIQENLAEAFNKLALANMQMGLDGVDEIADTSRIKTEISIKEQSFMGIVIPEINLMEIKVPLPDFGIFKTSIYLDEAQKLFSYILVLVLKYTEVENSAFRILTELRKTQKRLNALEYILIPEYNKTINKIEGYIEESERDEIISMKVIKDYILQKSSNK
ncbi:MAG: V-type ATP synthase subunit D [Candidatus Lokiarchaeota archaeon]|nr:V-type ATP synthase subunit D [Candidatus Lokiarchaeota archaeon]